MDCVYRCSLEIWGSRGRFCTECIFTVPPDYEPVVLIETANGTETVSMNADLHFVHSFIEAFYQEIVNPEKRKVMYYVMKLQLKLIDEVRSKGMLSDGYREIVDDQIIMEQPLIIQNEIGCIGIICKMLNGTLHFLIQVKMELGNIIFLFSMQQELY